MHVISLSFPICQVGLLPEDVLQGGVQLNVVPAQLSVGFDIRVAPTEDFAKFEEKIKHWCKEAGEGVTYEFMQKVSFPTLNTVGSTQPMLLNGW